MLPLLWLACQGATPPEGRAPAEAPPAAESYLLSHRPDLLAELALSPNNRPTDAAPERFPVPWQPAGSAGGVARYTAPSPLSVRLSPRIPETYAVVDAVGVHLPHSLSSAPRTWAADGQELTLRLPEGEDPSGYMVIHPETTALLARLNRATSRATDQAFAFRSEPLKSTQRRRGVYLPAPSSATWRLVVPAGGKLLADAALLRSPWRAEQGDGASIVAELIDAAGATHEVSRVALQPGSWEDVEADLSAWSGQVVQLRLRSEPGASGLADYLLVGEPTVYAPKADPRRIVLIFVDTLRADRLGAYGYSRPTTPRIDAWAAEAAVFTAARSVAPWTLPSSRALLSGRMPDTWDAGPILPEALGAAGWLSVALANNAYLSGPFGMDRGWSWHFYAPGTTARQQVGAARSVLEKAADRDLLLLVQLMDVHLPYAEPEEFRGLWAEGPDLLPDPIRRKDLLRWGGERAELAGWLSDRYDQSLRALDEALAPLLAALGPQDIAVVFGDHGEEFMEHGSFEHGHSLYDELLRVPLIVRAPGLPAGRVDAPVSLLDLAPTLLELAGAPPMADTLGRSLVLAARGDEGARAALAGRPQGFGFTFYGEATWGVLDGGRKWIAKGGASGYYDLASDPAEQSRVETPGIADVQPWSKAMGAALARPMEVAWRLVLPPVERPGRVVLTAPGGFEQVWTSQDAPEIPPAIVTLDGDRAEIVAGAGGKLPRELFAVSRDRGATLTVEEGGARAAVTPAFTGSAGELAAVGMVRVGYATTPRPAGALETYHPEVREELKALGYLE